MRSPDQQQLGMFSYVSVEQRVPADHPIRKLRVLVDTILAGLDAEFASVVSLKYIELCLPLAVSPVR